jgi:hypothetical protein
MVYIIRMSRTISHINGMCYHTKNKKRVVEKKLVPTSAKICVIENVHFWGTFLNHKLLLFSIKQVYGNSFLGH